MAQTGFEGRTNTEQVSDVIAQLLDPQDWDDKAKKLSEGCTVLGRAILDFAGGMGHSFVNVKGEAGESATPSPAALERLFWKTNDDFEFQALISGRYPTFQACLLPMRKRFRGLQSHLGVVFWAAENSISDLDDEEYNVVEAEYRFVCDALSPITIELETCLRMAERRWRIQPWDTPNRSDSSEDAGRAVRTMVSDSSSEDLPPDVDQLLKDEPEVQWMQKLYPSFCGDTLVGLCLNNEQLWKEAMEPVVALEMAPARRNLIAMNLVTNIPKIEDLVDFVAVVAGQASADDLSDIYEAVGKALHIRSMPAEDPDVE